jgi:2-oxoglutarate ferredoxin oxidoreductase subunit delta
MAKGRILIDEKMCKGCILCTTACPKGVIAMAEDRFTPKGYHPAELVDPDGECTGCAICALMCPEAAIMVFREVPAGRRQVPVSA